MTEERTAGAQTAAPRTEAPTAARATGASRGTRAPSATTPGRPRTPTAARPTGAHGASSAARRAPSRTGGWTPASRRIDRMPGPPNRSSCGMLGWAGPGGSTGATPSGCSMPCDRTKGISSSGGSSRRRGRESPMRRTGSPLPPQPSWALAAPRSRPRRPWSPRRWTAARWAPTTSSCSPCGPSTRPRARRSSCRTSRRWRPSGPAGPRRAASASGASGPRVQQISTLTVRMRAQKPGKLVLPPAELHASSGVFRSQPVTLMVKAGHVPAPRRAPRVPARTSSG